MGRLTLSFIVAIIVVVLLNVKVAAMEEKPKEVNVTLLVTNTLYTDLIGSVSLNKTEIKNIEVKKEIKVSSAISNEEKYKDVESKIFEITAFTAGKESTGKSPSHPLYGVTASGNMVQENYTIACPKSMKFGTEVYISFFDKVFVCHDRGKAITEGKIDVYMEDLDMALAFGRQKLEIKIVKVGE